MNIASLACGSGTEGHSADRPANVDHSGSNAAPAVRDQIGRVAGRDIRPPAQGYANDIISCLHEAGNPLCDWLWGSPAQARLQLVDWLARSSSELSERRIRLLKDGTSLLGFYIPLPSSELVVCRKADLLALTNYLRRHPDESMLTRMRQARSLFGGMPENAYYLSRIGVAPSARGHRVGRRLLEMFLDEGCTRGFKQFHLDVSAGNERAIRLYRSTGFEVVGDSTIAGTPIRYYSMAKIL